MGMSGAGVGTGARFPTFEETQSIAHLLHEAARLLDAGAYRDWVELFVDDGLYQAISAENHANGWPLKVMDDEKNRMLDRAEMIERFFQLPSVRYRHVVGNVDIAMTADDRAQIQAVFVVYMSSDRAQIEVQATGRYEDEVVRTGDRWQFVRRIAIFDNALLVGPLTYPL